MRTSFEIVLSLLQSDQRLAFDGIEGAKAGKIKSLFERLLQGIKRRDAGRKDANEDIKKGTNSRQPDADEEQDDDPNNEPKDMTDDGHCGVTMIFGEEKISAAAG